MKTPLDYAVIPEKKVAVDDISLFDTEEKEQRLEFGWFKQENIDGELLALRLALIDAMEIRITREDPDAEVDPIKFTWDIVSYAQTSIKIQLDIENAE